MQLEEKEEVKKMKIEQAQIYTEKCPRCGKEIQSLSREQADYNFKAHLLSCQARKNNEGKK